MVAATHRGCCSIHLLPCRLLPHWPPLLEPEASCDDEEIPAYTSTRQCGFFHQEWTTAPECTPVQAFGLHQRTPVRATGRS